MADRDDLWEDNVGGFSLVAGKRVAFLWIRSVLFALFVQTLLRIIFV